MYSNQKLSNQLKKQSIQKMRARAQPATSVDTANTSK